MSLRDIIGQDKAVNIILKTLQRGRIPSAYLFTGESGIGKKYSAINLAKALNCLNTSNEQHSPPLTKKGNRGVDACDACSSCKKIDSGVHPDFMLILPESGKIRIEEIRDIDESLSLKSFEGRYKVVIVDDADAMNQYAANAFLKTLEEPPEDSLIILVSASPDRLPDTIRSRCSLIHFSPLSQEACHKVLEKILNYTKAEPEKFSAKHKQLQILVRLSMGRPGSAISGELLEERSWFMKVLKDMLNKEKDGWTSREEMERWFNYLLILLRDVAVLKTTNNENKLINIDQKDYLHNISKSINLKSILENYRKLSDLKSHFYFNLNKSLTWNYTGSLLRKIMEH